MPVGEDPRHISGNDEPIRERATDWRILDVIDDRGAVAAFFKQMLVAPEPVRPPDLAIHESTARLPDFDLRSPPQGNPPSGDSIVDESARRHGDRLLGENFESKPRRSQFLEVPGLGEKAEDLVNRNRQDDLVIVEKCLHREELSSAREAIARTSPEKMIL